MRIFAIMIMLTLVLGCSASSNKPMSEEHQNMESGTEEVSMKPAQLESSTNYYVWSYEGRIYVIHNENVNAKFEEFPHMPFTKTILGLGPEGETVVFEVDTKKPEVTERLEALYAGKPWLVSSADDLKVWQKGSRLFVVGNQKTNESFKETGHLPYTKTFLGMGPNGETVVFEVDPKDDSFQTQLIEKYKSSRM
ncbi:MAG: hypothetical protein HQM11_10740 [SAR324 cluster bacterium]|nr:hypothetical protein [SAR324 cluster bacterium]